MSIIELTVTLEDIEPAVTRTLQVPADIRLDRLHLTIQAAMGWQNAHLYQFCIGEPYQWGADRWVAPAHVESPEDLPADKATLEQARTKAGDAGLTYLYDFGDDWVHSIEFGETSEVDPGQLYPRLTDIAGSCPPEDIGGLPGYEMFVAAMADPEHPEHTDLTDWYGGPFDPNAPASDELRLEVLKLAKRWRSKKTRIN
ncbi:plasmid pRiA4b ORF-3 family protein [Paracoccus sp. (in: a-proteobacteria)]|uniref:plasmid pRiA4b ORF-3 family protein n=1 Tax=Paracoccus sp. TaxID=267 RepID=UPI003A8AB92E